MPSGRRFGVQYGLRPSCRPYHDNGDAIRFPVCAMYLPAKCGRGCSLPPPKKKKLLKIKDTYKWTGSAIELVERVYTLDEMKSINNGEVPIHELAAFVGTLLGDIRNCYSAYTDMKRRKNESRTYFLDKMQERLNKRMDRDDEKEKIDVTSMVLPQKYDFD